MTDEEEQKKADYEPRIQFLIVEMSRKHLFHPVPKIHTPEDTLLFIQTHLSYCFLFFPAVTDLDTSGIHALEELYRSLQKRDVQVYAQPC